MKINFNFPILKQKLKSHKKIKKELLKLIDEEPTHSLKKTDPQHTDPTSSSISRLDWHNRNNFKRKWVQLLVKDLYNNFENQINEIGLKGVEINDLWFQQYFKEDTHGWHIHGHSFTGVYYLELFKDSPRTQIVEPTAERVITVEAKEGDVIIFPSVYIHRAPSLKTNKRKTIVSFNFSCKEVTLKFVERLNLKIPKHTHD